MSWTDERVETLKRMWAEGLSASQIAKDLGLTPAAVRRHLDALEAEQFIEVSALRSAQSGAGRPAGVHLPCRLFRRVRRLRFSGNPARL